MRRPAHGRTGRSRLAVFAPDVPAVVGTNVAVESAFDKCLYYAVDIEIARRREVTRFGKIGIAVIFQLPYVRKIYAAGIFFCHRNEVVEPARAQTARAERETVVLVRHGGNHSFVAFGAP